MKEIKCPSCKKIVPNVSMCPNCSFDLRFYKESRAKQRKRNTIALIGVLCFILLIILSRLDEIKWELGIETESTIKMKSFQIINESTFEMCFNEEVEGNYCKVTMVSKDGRKITKESKLFKPLEYNKVQENFCYNEGKMQHKMLSYSEEEREYYEKKLVNKNIEKVQWVIFRDEITKPKAKGELKINTN
jgi:hypothetical protein